MISSGERQETFDRNLSRVRARFPELADALVAADTGEIEVEEGPTGQRTFSISGQQVSSAYDPVREGERIAEKGCRAGADIVVALGFAMGHQLEAVRRMHPCRMVVFEPSAARLRAALELRTGLDWLEDPELFLTNDLDELRILLDRLYTPGLRIEVLTHPSLHRVDPAVVREAVDRIARIKDSVDIRARTRTLMLDAWSETTVDNAPAFLASPPFSILFRRFDSVPAVVCAAGPSLNQQLPTLQRFRDRLIVIAIGQSLRTLRSADIEPDFVHVVEHGPVAHQLESAGDNSELLLALPPQAHPALFDVPVRERLTVYPTANPVGTWIAGAMGEERFPGTGGTVAQCAAYLAHELGANPILLIGQDLAFTGGRVYADGSPYQAVGLRIVEGGRYEFTGMNEKMTLFGEPENHDTFSGEVITVEGWDGRPVATNVSYATFRDHYRDMGKELATQGIRLVNCTEGGARIPGIEHAPFSETCARLPSQPVRFRERFDAALAAHRRAGPERLVRAIADARGAFSALERAADRGQRDVRKARAALASEGVGPGLVRPLQRVARRQRHVQHILEGLPFLEAFVQPELHALGVHSRRSEALDASPEQALEEAELLFRASQRGAERARPLIGRLEAGISPRRSDSRS